MSLHIKYLTLGNLLVLIILTHVQKLCKQVQVYKITTTILLANCFAWVTLTIDNYIHTIYGYIGLRQ